MRKFDKTELAGPQLEGPIERGQVWPPSRQHFIPDGSDFLLRVRRPYQSSRDAELGKPPHSHEDRRLCSLGMVQRVHSPKDSREPSTTSTAVGSPKNFNTSGIEAVKALIATRHVDNPRTTQPANAIGVRKVPRADPGKAGAIARGHRALVGALLLCGICHSGVVTPPLRFMKLALNGAGGLS